MEARLYRLLRRFIEQVPHPRRQRAQFSDRLIVLVLLWAVLHDRSVLWATQCQNWPEELDHLLPGGSTMSRRLRSLGVLQLLERVLQQLIDAFAITMVCSIDSMPLRVGSYSHDRNATRGMAAGAKQRGYKLHGVCNNGVIRCWTLSGMARHDSQPGRELLERMPRHSGILYVTGDNAYDGNDLHQLAQKQARQLVTPPRASNQGKRDRNYNTEARLRSLDLCDPLLRSMKVTSGFGQALHAQRKQIERSFGRLVLRGMHLPPWVRRPRRVASWVTAKLIIDVYRQALKQRLVT